MKYFIILSIIIIIFSTMILVILPPADGKAKPYYDTNGNVLEGSISEKDSIPINGTKLGMFIHAKDTTKPVLLICGGGPGIPEYLLDQFYPNNLSDQFIVCYLEYRGTGLSYQSSFDPQSATTDQYIDDIVAVTNYLRERFSQDKIYILGHSFGSYIGIKTVQRHPELYAAYIAMSLECDQTASEKQAYAYMKDQYTQSGNTKKVNEFKKYDIETSEDDYTKYIQSPLRDNAMHELGIGTARNMSSVITGLFFPSLRCKAYTPAERINIWKGKMLSKKFPVVDDGFHFNAFNDVPTLNLPVYFFAGQYDYTCCYSLQKQYYETVQASLKAFYTFDNSAHSPLFEEPEKALQILTEDVQNLNNQLSD